MQQINHLVRLLHDLALALGVPGALVCQKPCSDRMAEVGEAGLELRDWVT
jgi:hypothetical protein